MAFVVNIYPSLLWVIAFHGCFALPVVTGLSLLMEPGESSWNPELKNTMREALFRSCHRYPVGMDSLLPDAVVPACERFLGLLEQWNRTHALTALPGPTRFEELILDSWALVADLAPLGPTDLVVDFGTGMGIPAIVLAIARPDLRVVALDKSRKKIAFVRQVALELQLPRLEPIAARAEELPPLGASLGVSKAVGSPALLAQWWARHGRAGAPLLLLKSDAWRQEELPGAGWLLRPRGYRLPSRGDRVILEIRKETGP